MDKINFYCNACGACCNKPPNFNFIDTVVSDVSIPMYAMMAEGLISADLVENSCAIKSN